MLLLEGSIESWSFCGQSPSRISHAIDMHYMWII